jgi:hypothetical protein
MTTFTTWPNGECPNLDCVRSRERQTLLCVGPLTGGPHPRNPPMCATGTAAIGISDQQPRFGQPDTGRWPVPGDPG